MCSNNNVIPPEPDPYRSARLLLLRTLRTEPLRSNIVLVSIPVLLVIFTYFGSNDFARRHFFTPETYSDLYGFIYHHLGAFVILGLCSVVLGSVLGFRPRGLGLGAGDWRFGLKFCAIVIPLLVAPITFAGSHSADVLREYPVSKEALRSGGAFAMHVAFYLCYYVGWEVFFRGYALFGLIERMGKWGAILVQVIPSTVIHTSIVCAGKPFAETIGAVPVGILLGWLTVRTRSVWYAFAIHAAIGVLTDVWIFSKG